MTTRKHFIAASSLFALAPALAEAASPSPKRTPPHELRFTFDQTRFNQILSKPLKHKQCFGATQIANGDVLFGMNNSIAAYEDYLKERPGAMQAVAVLYHGFAITLALSDAVWNGLVTPLYRNNDYVKGLSAAQREEVSKVTLGKGNPFLHSATKDPNDVSVESLVSKGSAFFVCHNSIVGLCYGVAHAAKMNVDEVHRRILAGIVPGALVVPAGVMAINACQEAKFTYIQSSL